jgi:hypothetical protein
VVGAAVVAAEVGPVDAAGVDVVGGCGGSGLGTDDDVGSVPVAFVPVEPEEVAIVGGLMLAGGLDCCEPTVVEADVVFATALPPTWEEHPARRTTERTAASPAQPAPTRGAPR